jgi:hypothetical protein
LLVLLFIIGYLFIKDPLNWFNKNSTAQARELPVGESLEEANNDTNRKEKFTTQHGEEKEWNPGKDTTLSNDQTIIDTSSEQSFITTQSNIRAGKLSKKNEPDVFKNKSPDALINSRKTSNLKKVITGKPVIKKIKGSLTSSINSAGDSTATADAKETNIPQEQQPPANEKTHPDTRAKTNQAKDSLTKKEGPDTENFSKVKRDSVEKKEVYFSAGAGLQQLLPVAGQKANPYNSSGRKNSLGDYVPSVFARMYKDQKWFIQSEFRYGAPQYTKDILFRSKKLDTSSSFGRYENSRIKKTYYHQLPLSFNYFILPGLSVGTGVSFNKFKTALVEQEVYITNPFTTVDSLLSNATVTQKKPDSNFVSSFFQGLIDAQYAHKRFSIGLRYSFGLQPFLKFKLPGAEERREKSTSLQIFLRYELWRSKKK